MEKTILPFQKRNVYGDVEEEVEVLAILISLSSVSKRALFLRIKKSKYGISVLLVVYF